MSKNKKEATPKIKTQEQLVSKLGNTIVTQTKYYVSIALH